MQASVKNNFPKMDAEAKPAPCLTIDDVVKRLNVSKRTVERMIQRGDIVGFYVGRVWRMKPENLERWIEKRTA